MKIALIAFWTGWIGSMNVCPAAEWKTRVDVQIVEIPAPDALDLIERFRDPHASEGAAENVDAMIADGRARLRDWKLLWSVHVDVDARLSRDVFYAGGAEVAKGSRGVAFSKFNTPKGYRGPGPEMRQVGSHFNVSASPGEDGRNVSLAVRGEWVWQKANRSLRMTRTRGGLETHIDVPPFGHFGVTTSLFVPAGKRTLLGAFNGPVPEDPVTLLIIRAVPFPSPPVPNP